MTERNKLTNLEKAAITIAAINPITVKLAMETANKITRRDFIKGVWDTFYAGMVAEPLSRIFLNNQVESGQGPNEENITIFAGQAIGESGVGAISRLEKQQTHDMELKSAIIRGAARASVTRVYQDANSRLQSKVFDMIGVMGDEAPFAILIETDNNNNPLGPAYVVFGEKPVIYNDNGVDKEIWVLGPPNKDNLRGFYTMAQKQDGEDIVLGVVDTNDPTISWEIFRIVTGEDEAGKRIPVKAFFTPPYANGIGPIEIEPANVFKLAMPVKAEIISDEFIVIQDKFGESDLYDLKNDGSIEMKKGEEEFTTITQLSVSPKDGTMMVTHNGETFEADASTIVIDGQKITFKDTDGKTWAWDGENLKEEVREFIPAETVDFSENLPNYELKLAPDADLKAIYWDIAVVQLGSATSKSEGMEENRKVYEEIIKDFPQWEGIGSGSDYKERVEFMKEFLKRTGGKMTVQNHNFEKFEVDFNQPIKFEVVEVKELPKGYKGYLMGTGINAGSITGGGGIMDVDESDRLVYQIAILPGALERTQTDDMYIYKSWKWSVGGVISDMIRKTISETAYKDRDSVSHKYQLYTKGGVPKSGNFYSNVTWTFIK